MYRYFRYIQIGVFVSLITILSMIRVSAQSPLHQYTTNDLLSGLAWSPDGQLLAVSGDWGIKMFNDQLQELGVLTPGPRPLQISWKPDGLKLASGDADGKIRIWERPSLSSTTFMISDTLDTTYDAVLAVSWSPDSTKIAALVRAPFDTRFLGVVGTVQIWKEEGNSWILYSTLSEEVTTPLRKLIWNPDSTNFLGHSDPGYLYIADADTGYILQSDYGIDTTAMAWYEGNKLATSDEGLYTYIMTPSQVTRVDLLLDAPIYTAIDWHPGGKYLAGGNYGGQIDVWDMSIPEIVLHFDSSAEIIEVEWHPNRNVLATLGNNGIIELWDVSLLSPSKITGFTLIDGDTCDEIGPLNNTGNINPTAIETSNLVIRANTTPSTVGSVVFDLNGIIHTDDIAPYEFSNWTLTPGQYNLTATSYSQAGGTGTAGMPLTINFIVGDSSTAYTTISINALTVEWSPDGSLIAVGTESGVSLFTAGLQFVAVLPGYTQQVVSLSWSPDNQMLAGVGYPYQAGVELYVPVFTSSLLVWQRNPDNNFSLSQRFDYPDQTNIVDVKWSPDGARLAVRTSEYLPRSDTAFGDIQIWNTATWAIESSLQNMHRAMYADMAWNPEGSLLASGAESWCYELRPCDLETQPRGGTLIFIIDPSNGELISYALTGLPIDGISWSSNNEIAVATDGIRLYDNTLANIIRDTTNYSQYGLEWMPNQSELLLWSYDGVIDIVDSMTFQSRFNLPVADFQALSLSPDGNMLAVLTSTHLSIHDISDSNTATD